MEENNLNVQPTTTPTVEPQKNNSFLVVLLSILLLLACLIAGFFAYQTQNLVKELTKLNSNTPISSIQATVDPTLNWTLYNFDTINLELKVPNDFTVELGESNSESIFTAYIQNKPFNAGVLEDSYQLYILWQKSETMTDDEFLSLKDELVSESVIETTIDGKIAIKGQIKGDRNRFVTYILDNGSKISFFTSEPTETNEKITDQILATIKFKEAEGIVCTQEAKICPDGSTVGRSGPKCEFAACPTPTN